MKKRIILKDWFMYLLTIINIILAIFIIATEGNWLEKIYLICAFIIIHYVIKKYTRLYW